MSNEAQLPFVIGGAKVNYFSALPNYFVKNNEKMFLIGVLVFMRVWKTKSVQTLVLFERILPFILRGYQPTSINSYSKAALIVTFSVIVAWTLSGWQLAGLIAVVQLAFVEELPPQ